MKSLKPSNNGLAPPVKFNGERVYVKFSRSCFKQDKTTFNHKKAVNIYIAYDLKSNLNNFLSYSTKLFVWSSYTTKNSDIGKYSYARYGIGFDSKGIF